MEVSALTLLARPSNETQDQRPRELEVTFAL